MALTRAACLMTASQNSVALFLPPSLGGRRQKSTQVQGEATDTSLLHGKLLEDGDHHSTLFLGRSSGWSARPASGTVAHPSPLMDLGVCPPQTLSTTQTRGEGVPTHVTF